MDSRHGSLPQSWIGYAYAVNNPLRGLKSNRLWARHATPDRRGAASAENRQKFRDAYALLLEAFAKCKKGTEEYEELRAIISKIGTEGDGNNVRVAFSTEATAAGRTRPTLGGRIKITFNFEVIEKELSRAGLGDADIATARAALVVHEGRHAVERPGSALKWLFSRQERLNFERRAINAQSLFYRALNRREPFGPLWNPSWPTAKSETRRKEAIERMVQRYYGRTLKPPP
jgi:hypothetical protein